MTFDIVSYVGAIPIRFGMSEEEVIALAGEPRIRSEAITGGMCFDYFFGDTKHGHFNVGFDQHGRVNHVGFSAGCPVQFEGIDLFAPGSLEELLKRDGEALEGLGQVVFPNLGIATDGFHTDNPMDRGIAVFVHGEYDKFKNRMKPYRK